MANGSISKAEQLRIAEESDSFVAITRNGRVGFIRSVDGPRPPNQILFKPVDQGFDEFIHKDQIVEIRAIDSSRAQKAIQDFRNKDKRSDVVGASFLTEVDRIQAEQEVPASLLGTSVSSQERPGVLDEARKQLFEARKQALLAKVRSGTATIKEQREANKILGLVTPQRRVVAPEFTTPQLTTRTAVPELTQTVTRRQVIQDRPTGIAGASGLFSSVDPQQIAQVQTRTRGEKSFRRGIEGTGLEIFAPAAGQAQSLFFTPPRDQTTVTQVTGGPDVTRRELKNISLLTGEEAFASPPLKSLDGGQFLAPEEVATAEVVEAQFGTAELRRQSKEKLGPIVGELFATQAELTGTSFKNIQSPRRLLDAPKGIFDAGVGLVSAPFSVPITIGEIKEDPSFIKDAGFSLANPQGFVALGTASLVPLPKNIGFTPKIAGAARTGGGKIRGGFGKVRDIVSPRFEVVGDKIKFGSARGADKLIKIQHSVENIPLGIDKTKIIIKSRDIGKGRTQLLDLGPLKKLKKSPVKDVSVSEVITELAVEGGRIVDENVISNIAGKQVKSTTKKIVPLGPVIEEFTFTRGGSVGIADPRLFAKLRGEQPLGLLDSIGTPTITDVGKGVTRFGEIAEFKSGGKTFDIGTSGDFTPFGSTSGGGSKFTFIGRQVEIPTRGAPTKTVRQIRKRIEIVDATKDPPKLTNKDFDFSPKKLSDATKRRRDQPFLKQLDDSYKKALDDPKGNRLFPDSSGGKKIGDGLNLELPQDLVGDVLKKQQKILAGSKISRDVFQASRQKPNAFSKSIQNSLGNIESGLGDISKSFKNIGKSFDDFGFKTGVKTGTRLGARTGLVTGTLENIGLKSDLLQTTKGLSITQPKSVSRTTSIPILGQITTPIPKIITTPEQTTTQITSLINIPRIGPFTRVGPRTGRRPPIGGFPPFVVPPLVFGGSRGRGRRARTVRGKTRFQPSLTGIVFDIKTPTIPKGTLSGLEIRGVFDPPKKKRRRKK